MAVDSHQSSPNPRRAGGRFAGTATWAAEVFPILDDDELEDLAFDIRDNGLLQPLVVAEIDGQMMLIDGRNRRMACQAFRIVPGYVLLDGLWAA